MKDSVSAPAGSPSPRPAPDRWGIVLLALTLLAALLLAARDLRAPGLYYDELLFANAALGAKQEAFVQLKIAGVPVLLMDYIGALKAWLYTPIFAVCGVNEWSVRLPAIVLGLAGALLLALAVRTWFGRTAGWIAAVLVCLDPGLLLHSRLDWGPNAIMFLCRGALIFALAQWWRTERPRWLWLALAACVAGTFDKLNFLWLACAALGALALTAPGPLRRLLRERRAHACLWALAAGVLLLVALARAVALTGAADPATAWPARLHQAWQLLHLTLIGGGPLDFIVGDGWRLAALMIPAGGMLLIAAILGALSPSPRPQGRAWAFLTVFTLLTGAAFVVTRTATGPHHAAVLCGLPALLLAPGIARLASVGRSRLGQVAARAAVLGAVGCGALAMAVTSWHCVTLLRMPTNANWDPANSALAAFAATRPAGDFVMADWGMGNQLLALTAGRRRVDDRWPRFASLDSAVEALAALDPRRDHYLVRRLPGGENITATNRNVVAALAHLQLETRPVLVLSSVHGRPLIEVLLLPARAP